MILRLLPFILLAACSSAAPAPEGPPEVLPEGYADVDTVAIRKEADDLDIDQLRERMDALRDAIWRNQAPVAPADATVSIDLAVTSSFARFDGSSLLWREANGGWQWRHATHDGQERDATADKTTGGAVDAAQAAKLDHALASPLRRAEVWYSPHETPLKGAGARETCFDGASYLMVIRRKGEPDEIVVQSCTTRWLNGQLIELIGNIGRP